jgi:hypothetical protein
MAWAGMVRPGGRARTAGRAARAWVHCGRHVFTYRGCQAAVGPTRRMASRPCGGEVVRPARLREAGTESSALPGGQRGHPRQRVAALGVSCDHGGGGDSAGHDGLASRWAARTGGGTAEPGRGRVWSRRPNGQVPLAVVMAGSFRLVSTSRPALSRRCPAAGRRERAAGSRWLVPPTAAAERPTVMDQGCWRQPAGAADARPGSCRRRLEGGGG